jgi:hypothetical protein
MVGKYGPRIIPREKELHSHLVYQPIRIKKKASTANSLVIAGKIAGVWLVQIKEAGRLLMHQYPEQFSSILRTFLSTA